jgi:hypothetical protein
MGFYGNIYNTILSLFIRNNGKNNGSFLNEILGDSSKIKG